MREIKFRIWFEVEKNMDYEPSTDDNLLNSNFTPHFGEVYMQYTGLKDKNGVEIFEGDIVRVNYRGENELTTVGWVEYTKPSFIVKTSSDTIRPLYLCLYSFDKNPLFNWAESEVIGNIYENPELLNPKERND